MSFFSTAIKVGTGLLGFGGSSQGPNIARSLSAKAGCTILQKDAANARAAMAAGINPCTGLPRGGLPPLAPTPGFGPGFGSVPATGGAGSGGGSAIGPLARMAGAGGLRRTATGRVSSIVLASGQTFSRAKAAALIRRVGFEVATVALGISLLEAAEILLTQSRAGRRRRGISGAQIANAKRTMCTISRMARDLGIKPAPVRRKTACR